MAAVCPRNTVYVPSGQRTFQLATEAASLFVAVPTLLRAAVTQRELPGAIRLGLAGVAAAHLVVDGGLLATWGRYGTNRSCIGHQRLRAHKTSEAVALLVGVPFIFWVATQPEVDSATKQKLRMLAWAELLIDGYLLGFGWRR